VSSLRVPAGYVRLDLPHARVVTRDHLATALRNALSDGSTLHAWAARQPDVREMRGRDVTWAVDLSDADERVVVRHNRHGGAFAQFTGDLFLWPTRAPLELEIALQLEQRGVATPAMLAYAVYRSSLGPFARSDVATREVTDARDLGEWLLDRSTKRAPLDQVLDATARLAATLARAGARHHDLNVKNVLLAPNPNGLVAWALDVDRVTFQAPGRDVLVRNLARLARSVRKWRTEHGALVDEAWLGELERRASALLA
jgi:hypothetical protein